MKTPSEDIFNLIKSLTRNEKTLFKIFYKKENENIHYLLMFDAIDALKLYDEKKLLLICGKKGISNNIKDIKKYLKELIFKFLEYRYFDHSVGIQLQRYLQRIEVLFDKGLLELAKRQAIKAEQIAIEHLQYPYLFSIQHWKQRIKFRETNLMSDENTENEKISDELKTMVLYKNITEYRKIHGRVHDLILSQGGNLDEKTSTNFVKILENPLLVDEDKALTDKAKYYYWFIKGNVHLGLQNWEDGFVSIKHAIHYFEKGKITPNERIDSFSKLMIASIKLIKSEEIISLKKEAHAFFETIPKKQHTNHLYNIYIAFISNYIAYHIELLNIQEALVTSNELFEIVEKQKSPEKFIVYYIHRFLLFFYTSDFRKALQSINKVLSDDKSRINQNIVNDTRLYNLIVHYELGNEDIILKLYKSYNVSEKRKFLSKTESTLLNFFRTIIYKNTGVKNKIIVFTKLKQELELCKDEPIHREFNFISWAECKIKNRPMIEILRNKTNRT